MKSKILLIFVVILFSVLSHYILKNDILKHSKENEVVFKELNSERAINKDLTSEYFELQSPARIINIASNQLNMAYDEKNIRRVGGSISDSRRQLTLIDFLIPDAEALTTN